MILSAAGAAYDEVKHSHCGCRPDGIREDPMSPCEFAMTISAIACCIAEGRSSDEIALISSVLSQLGDTLETIAAQQALCCPENVERVF